MGVKQAVTAAVTAVVGAFVTNEVVSAMGYTGPGSELTSIFALIVIAVGMLGVLNKSGM